MLHQHDAVGDIECLRVIMHDHRDRQAPLGLQPQQQVDDQSASRAPIAANGSSSSRMRAAEFTARATAIAWRWPPDSRSTGRSTEGMWTPIPLQALRRALPHGMMVQQADTGQG